VVLSHDTSGCSFMFVALPPPSDTVPALWCVVSTPVMRVCVCLLYVSAVKRRRVAVLHVCHSRHSLAVCRRSVMSLLLCAERLFARAWYRCVSRCDVRDRRIVAAFQCLIEWDDGVRYLSGCLVVSLAHCVVRER
jgi:hypothetical protein